MASARGISAVTTSSSAAAPARRDQANAPNRKGRASFLSTLHLLRGLGRAGALLGQSTDVFNAARQTITTTTADFYQGTYALEMAWPWGRCPLGRWFRGTVNCAPRQRRHI